MRVYKFRAICNDADYGNEEYYLKMIYSETINQIAFGDEVDEVRLLVDGKWLKVNSETVGLYTGIKDKNCIEIYTGDIVWFGKEIGFIGELQHGSFTFNRKETYWKCDPLPVFAMSLTYVEVIGNIYENPELLEGRE